MDDKCKKIFSSIVAVLVLIFIGFLTGYFFSQWKIKGRYSDAINGLEHRIAELTESNKKLQGVNSDLADTNKRLTEANSRIRDELSELGDSIGRAGEYSKRAEGTVGQLAESVDATDEIGRRIAGYLERLNELYSADGE